VPAGGVLPILIDQQHVAVRERQSGERLVATVVLADPTRSIGPDEVGRPEPTLPWQAFDIAYE